jgi:hypothetical protein
VVNKTLTKASHILSSLIFRTGSSNLRPCFENLIAMKLLRLRFQRMDANGQPIPMNARERHDFNRELRAYKELDKTAYARIMKACRLNPKTKLLCERVAISRLLTRSLFDCVSVFTIITVGNCQYLPMFYLSPLQTTTQLFSVLSPEDV